MCYLLKLIEDDLRSQLHDIREMRNACAHSKRPISFKTSQLMNVANRVIKDSLFKDAPTIRVAFLSECSFIFNILISSKEEALKALQASFARDGKLLTLSEKWKSQ